MFRSAEERIARELAARLETVVLYDYGTPERANVYRVNRDASNWTPRNNSIVIVQGGSARIPELDCPGNPPAIAFATTFACVAFVRQKDREDDPDAHVVNQIGAMMRRAITRTGAEWYTFGGVSFNCDIGESNPFPQTSDGHAGVILELVAQFRISERDPFEVRA